MVARAKKELLVLAEEAEVLDRDLSKLVVEAREQLVELEEKLRTAEAERQAPLPRPSVEETLLSKEETLLESKIDEVLRVTKEPQRRMLDHLKQQLTEVRKRLAMLGDRRVATHERLTQVLIALRKQIVRQEEELQRLERKRAGAREDAARRREAVSDRLRRLEEGEEAAPAAGTDRLLRTLQRRLKSIESDIAELRQDIRQMRRERRR
jgi:hypothetical protein